MINRLACSVLIAAALALPAEAQQGPGGPVIAVGAVVTKGTPEEELGRALAAVLLTSDADERGTFADARTGPRFAEMLGGPAGVRAEYQRMHERVVGMALADVRDGPDGSIILIFRDGSGGEVKLHCLRGVSLPDGRLKVGGWMLLP